MGTLPASEVKNPKVTIPKAIMTGMLIATLFYLSTNFVVYGVINWTVLEQTSIPLVLVGSALLGTFGAVVMSIGALVSVTTTDGSGTLGTARISYAMAIDGLFPRVFARVHPKFKTPYMALAIDGVIAFVFSIYSGIAPLISFVVFNLAFVFLLTCFALINLRRTYRKQLYGQDILLLIGIVVCLFLMVSTSLVSKIMDIGVILAGIPIYVFFSPKTELPDVKRMVFSEEAMVVLWLSREERFLANYIWLMYRGMKWIVSRRSLRNY